MLEVLALRLLVLLLESVRREDPEELSRFFAGDRKGCPYTSTDGYREKEGRRYHRAKELNGETTGNRRRRSIRAPSWYSCAA